MGDDALIVWVVYDRPADYPSSIVVRAQAVQPSGLINVQRAALLFDTLDAARRFLAQRGLARLARHPTDPAVIVETWI